jgi:membrane associated rhomboid family serine protease
MTDFRPGGFQQLPNIVKNLVIINGLVFLLQYAFEQRGVDLSVYLGLHYWQSPLFHWWQPLTHMFMHGSLGHIFFNMFALWMFGRILEDVWGPKRFLMFYLICGIGAAACHMAVLTIDYMPLYHKILSNPQAYLILPDYYKHISGATVGASGAVFGLLFAFGYLFPNTELMLLFPPIPIKAKWFVTGYAAIELFLGFKNSAGDNVAHFAHLGGMLFAFILLRIWNDKLRNRFY